ncbi:MAG: hypothetical protein IKA32_02755 [Lentisphaeria bacterium]|nr:hypothetical protein [Lentisphaeria bacterium]
MKEIISGIIAGCIFAALFFGMVWYGTSAEVWYAGEHTAGCDGTEHCGCYERLVSGDIDR